MSTLAPAYKARGLALMFGWRRVVIALVLGGLVGLVLSPTFVGGTPPWQVMAREMTVALAALIAFGIFEQWPRKLPAWIARWFLQICAVAFVIPPTALVIYLVITSGESIPFWKSQLRLNGFATMIATGLLVAPWTAVAALFRQRELQLQDQAQAFELERSELERKALDSRLRLLQSQVEPHFLFNTLERARAGRLRIPAGFHGPRQPHRVSSERRAAPERTRHDHGPGIATRARLPGAHAHAHARSLAVLGASG